MGVAEEQRGLDFSLNGRCQGGAPSWIVELGNPTGGFPVGLLVFAWTSGVAIICEVSAPILGAPAREGERRGVAHDPPPTQKLAEAAPRG